MVRPKKSDGESSAPKRTRSRFGCWPCKARKVKCGEEKPVCKNCERQGETCDYKVRLNWSHAGSGLNTIDFSSQSVPTTPTIVFPSPEVFSGKSTPNPPPKSPGAEGEPTRPFKTHGRSRSNVSTPVRDLWDVDPALKQNGKITSGMLTVDDSSIRNGSYGSLTTGGAAFDEQSTSISPGSHIYSPDSRTLPNIVLNSSATMPMMPSMFSRMSSAGHSPVRHNSDGQFENSNRNKRQRLSNFGGSSSILKYDSPKNQPAAAIDLHLNTSNSGAPVTSGFTFEPSPINASTNYEQSRSSVPVSFLVDKSPSRQNSGGSRDPHSIEFRISAYRSYGYDTGQPDRDVDHNDDLNAIVGSPAIAQGSSFDTLERETQTFALDNYYENPVQINIPKDLEPLPEQLQSNPMNLLYFHHFINHVARILTPHDCPANPYRTVIPKSKHPSVLKTFLIS
jgi:Fungal Zn(2)-Cys(6) binuclear cluster domain